MDRLTGHPRRAVTARAVAAALWLFAVLLPAARAVELAVPIDTAPGQLAALWFPAPGEGAHPAVVALHGCGGARDSQGRWAEMWRRYAAFFNAEHMGLLVVDSLTTRGLGSLCSVRDSERGLREPGRRDDAYAALRWLAARSEVDASRLAVVGWSHGAQTVLAAVDRSDPVDAAQAVKPRAAAAFYPGCGKPLGEPAYAPMVPTLVMIGEKDDWTLAANCTRLAERIADPSKFSVVVYPGAYHGFDSHTAVKTLQHIGNTRSGTATYGENREARLDSNARLFAFLAKTLDLKLSMDDAARAALPPLPRSSAEPAR